MPFLAIQYQWLPNNEQNVSREDISKGFINSEMIHDDLTYYHLDKVIFYYFSKK
jgi:hypothetical protein